jgi:hypothetical protein
MTQLGEHAVTTLGAMSVHAPPAETPYERWVEAYGPLLAEQLQADCSYAVIRVEAVEFAYSEYDRYLRALAQAWEAGFAPDVLPSTLGRDLPQVAPALRGVNVDLSGLESPDVEPARRRFS